MSGRSCRCDAPAGLLWTYPGECPGCGVCRAWDPSRDRWLVDPGVSLARYDAHPDWDPRVRHVERRVVEV